MRYWVLKLLCINLHGGCVGERGHHSTHSILQLHSRALVPNGGGECSVIWPGSFRKWCISTANRRNCHSIQYFSSACTWLLSGLPRFLVSGPIGQAYLCGPINHPVGKDHHSGIDGFAGLTHQKLYIAKGSISRFLTSHSAQLATKCGDSVTS